MSELRRVESWTYPEIIAASRARYGGKERDETPEFSYVLAEAKQAEAEEAERIQREREKPKQSSLF